MAKSKKRASKKAEKLSLELQIRISALAISFLSLAGALEWGIVGEILNNTVVYLVGNYYGVTYGIIIIAGIYVFIKRQLPKFGGPKAIGLYLVLGALLTYASIPKDTSIIGNDVINYFMEVHKTIPGGGIIGALLYAAFSILFDHGGTVVLVVLLGFTGALILIGKSYLEIAKNYFKNMKTLRKDEHVKSKNNNENNNDIFPYKKKKGFSLFSEKAFDEKDEESINQEQPNLFNMNDLETDIPNIAEPILKQDIIVDKELEVDFSRDNGQARVNKHYRLPSLSLLKDNPSKGKNSTTNQYALDNASRLTNVLEQFGVKVTVSDIYIGPTVIKYELKPEIGTRVNKITSLQDDIKMALAAKDIRIEAPIPGKMAVGIEIPSQEATLVTLKEVLKDLPENKKSNKLCVPLGKDVTGQSIFAELDRMPHLLIAGATGSGKSICVNGVITSILMRAKPDEVKLLLVDPKKVELTGYNDVPHLICPVVTDPKKAAVALRKIVTEMERRYDLFALANTRNIGGYNEMAAIFNQSLISDDEKKETLPYIVVILDEVADLMLVASKEVEDCIMRISQMARAAGIHLIVATQRPSTDVITGVIKANIPSRIAFAVSSSIDSRTILDQSGAEKLLGKGDMLFSPMGASNPTRIQGSFVSDEEVQDIVKFVIRQQEATYDENFASLDSKNFGSLSEDSEDEIYEDVREFVIKAQKASASLLQRQFRLGYNRAARLIDELEANGIIGPQLGSKPREVLIRGYKEEE